MGVQRNLGAGGGGSVYLADREIKKKKTDCKRKKMKGIEELEKRRGKKEKMRGRRREAEKEKDR